MELRLLDIAEPELADPADLVDWVATRCPHLPVDDRLVALGYRFYHLGDSELPPFFSRRFTAGRRNGAITLLGGVDPKTGEGVLDGLPRRGRRGAPPGAPAAAATGCCA